MITLVVGSGEVEGDGELVIVGEGVLVKVGVGVLVIAVEVGEVAGEAVVVVGEGEAVRGDSGVGELVTV